MKFRFCGDLDCPDWVLAEINTLSKMSSIRLKVLVTQILSFCLAGEMNYDKVLKLAGDNADGITDIKGGIAAIHFMINSAAKYDVDDKVLIQEIQQLGLPKENSEIICKLYREQKDNLRTVLEEASYRIAKLVSAEWRVDQVLASSDTSKNNKLVHLNLSIDTIPNPNDQSIQQSALHLNQEERWKDVAFELSAEQLNVLIHELSQAHQMMQNLDS